jgi:hypothetical protein
MLYFSSSWIRPQSVPTAETLQVFLYFYIPFVYTEKDVSESVLSVSIFLPCLTDTIHEQSPFVILFGARCSFLILTVDARKIDNLHTLPFQKDYQNVFMKVYPPPPPKKKTSNEPAIETSVK